MKLFIETNSGRLQNLYLLQDVRVVDSQIQEGKFAVGFVQENGIIIEDELFDTYEDAENAVESVKEELLAD